MLTRLLPLLLLAACATGTCGGVTRRRGRRARRPRGRGRRAAPGALRLVRSRPAVKGHGAGPGTPRPRRPRALHIPGAGTGAPIPPFGGSKRPMPLARRHDRTYAPSLETNAQTHPAYDGTTNGQTPIIRQRAGAFPSVTLSPRAPSHPFVSYEGA